MLTSPTTGWDLAWPRAFEPLLLRGAEMIIAPTYWTGTDGGPEGMKHNPNSETDFLQVLVKTRAWDNECAILVSGCLFFFFAFIEADGFAVAVL